MGKTSQYNGQIQEIMAKGKKKSIKWSRVKVLYGCSFPLCIIRRLYWEFYKKIAQHSDYKQICKSASCPKGGMKILCNFKGRLKISSEMGFGGTPIQKVLLKTVAMVVFFNVILLLRLKKSFLSLLLPLVFHLKGIFL